MDPEAWSAPRNTLNCTCAWPFPPPPQVYPGPEAGARLLGEFSGGGVRGEPQWLPGSSRLARTRTRPTLLSSRRPPGSPAPPAARHAQRPVSLQVRDKVSPTPTHVRRRGRGGGEKGSNATDSLTSCSQTLYARRGARSSPAAPGPPDPRVTTEREGGGGRGGSGSGRAESWESRSTGALATE